MAARVTDGPEKSWLELTDLVSETGLSRNTLKRLIASGEFPRACKITGRIRLWPWSDVVFWRLKMEIGDRLAAGEMPDDPDEEEISSPQEPIGGPRRPK